EHLLPGQEPLGPAVVPVAGQRAADDRDGVAGYRVLVVPLRVGRGQVHATVADVRRALLTHRPGSVVVVVAAPGEAHRPVHRDVLVTLPAHQRRVGLLDGQVGAVGGFGLRAAR